MDKKILELALEALELRKASIDSEIAAIRAEMSSRTKPAAAAPRTKTAPTKKRGPKSKAAKKAQSERMKAYWAKKRAESDKKQSK
jgi:hypothetical protein